MHRDLFGTIIQIGDILVSEKVVTPFGLPAYRKIEGGYVQNL